MNTDVLVIGAQGSPQWLWKKYGTKLKKADLLRKEFGRPLIIQEYRWQKAMRQ